MIIRRIILGVSLFFLGQKSFSQVDYKTDIQPIFNSYCSGCHTGGGSSGGQDLSSYSSLMLGGNSGPTIIPGDSQNSILWKRISDGSMPPSSNDVPLTKVEIVAKWINEGALESVATQNKPPESFKWISPEQDSIFISSDNLQLQYSLEWEESKDPDGDQITYLLYAGTDGSPLEEVFSTTNTFHQIPYESFIQNTFEQIPTASGATVNFSLKSTDGADTTKISGNDRVLFVDRTEYLYVDVDEVYVPNSFVLHPNFPNPFNPSTQIQFDVPKSTSIKFTIINMLGQKVKTFNLQNIPAGNHSIVWNSTNDFGERVPAGVYLYQLEAGSFIQTKKMILLK
ncbi:T9SS C-terminal target domain-containing protein [bacterium]|nr:MAG: T9SS C-terminal target domain-containing protein [bacterium]